MRIFALWCHPRSMSTAIERIMRERGDLEVLHEPFMYHYYSGTVGDFAGFDPDPDHPRDYAGIRAMIRTRAAQGPVFFKDMGYYVLDQLPGDAAFMGEMDHTFLVRDPAESILSYHRRDPSFTLEEVGLEGQWQLYSALVAAGHTPRVIRSRDIRENPGAVMAWLWSDMGLSQTPEALSWDAEVPADWATVTHWHGDTLTSGAIRPPDPARDLSGELAALGEPYLGFEVHHRPFFDKLCAVAWDPGHQK